MGFPRRLELPSELVRRVCEQLPDVETARALCGAMLLSKNVDARKAAGGACTERFWEDEDAADAVGFVRLCAERAERRGRHPKRQHETFIVQTVMDEENDLTEWRSMDALRAMPNDTNSECKFGRFYVCYRVADDMYEEYGERVKHGPFMYYEAAWTTPATSSAGKRS